MPWRSSILFQRSTPASQSPTYQSRSTSFIALRIGTSSLLDRALSRSSSMLVDGLGRDVIVVVLLFLRAALQAVGEVGRGVARDLAAVQVEAQAEPEVQMNFWIVGRSMPPSCRTSSE